MKNAAAGANDRDGIITTIEDQQDQQQREQLQLQLQLQLQQNQNHNLRIFDVTVGIRSKKTAAVYQSVFKRFLKHIKINDLQVLLDYSRTRPQIIKEMLVGYVLYLRDEKPGRKLTRGSIKLHLAAILHFFQINSDEFTLTMRNFRIHLPPDEFIDNDDRAYTHQEIFQILKTCDVRSRVLVLLLCSSGMRVGAARTLQIGDLTEMTLDDVNLLYRIQVYARTRDRYYTFCTPECYNAIQEYMEYRAASGETITNNSKAPLIREQFNTDDPFRLNVPKTLSDDAIRYIIRNIVKKSGVYSQTGKEVHLSHGMRKFFMTQCESKGMKSINVKMLMGHDIGVSGHYYRPTESDLLDDYLKHAVDSLTIDPTHRLQKQVSKLESEKTEEIARLRTELAKIKEDKEESSEQWEQMRHQIDKIRQKMGLV